MAKVRISGPAQAFSDDKFKCGEGTCDEVAVFDVPRALLHNLACLRASTTFFLTIGRSGSSAVGKLGNKRFGGTPSC